MNKLIGSLLCITLSIMHTTRCSLREGGNKYLSAGVTFDQIRMRLEAMDHLNNEYLNALLTEEITASKSDEIHVLIDCLPIERGTHVLLKILRAYYAICQEHKKGIIDYYIPIALHLIKQGYNLFEDLGIMKFFESYNDDQLFNKLVKADFKRMFRDPWVIFFRTQDATAFDYFAITHFLTYTDNMQFKKSMLEMFSSVRSHYG